MEGLRREWAGRAAPSNAKNSEVKVFLAFHESWVSWVEFADGWCSYHVRGPFSFV